MSRGEGITYHPKFDEYVEMIVKHPNYKGLYYDRNADGRVNWVVTGKSAKGQRRQVWWDAKCRELGVPIQKGCYAVVARMIHPTGKHVCQCCGKERSIFYEYPTLPNLKKLNKAFGLDLKQTDYTLLEFVDQFCITKQELDKVASIFGLPQPTSTDNLKRMIKTELVDKCSSRLSPGVMCNPPDRYNGFHSYALCCRKEKDTGRHDDNMKTYTQDRRAYEDWSDGDYNLANRLMGEFHKCPPMACPICGKIEEMTADHIGPISLGFCHSRHFAPMCRSCNSAKNNRFTKADVDELLKLEKSGNQVVSWHSKYIWDILKLSIKNDDDAKKVSSVMAKCHQNVLYVFSLIYSATGQTFLERYLHPEFSMVDYRFQNVDLKDLSKMTVIATPLDSKNKRKNQERYIRIAFESLKDFGEKDNRKNYFVVDENNVQLHKIISNIAIHNYEEADKQLKKLLKEVAFLIASKEGFIKRYELSNDSDFINMAAEPSADR